MKVVNPATGEVVGEHREHGPEEIEQRLSGAHRAFLEWRETTFSERREHMHRASRLLHDRREDLAGLMTLEMGKPISDARKEVDKCAWVCEHYAREAERLLAPRPELTDARKSFVTFRPLGVVLAVMPWNFPLWQVFRFAAPNVMAGNAGLLKHASNVPGCALAIEAIFRDAGFPSGLFAALLVPSHVVASIIGDPRIVAVTLTGSTPAGRSVARTAGESLKKTVLELGGSDAYVILEDADLDLAVETCVTSRLINSGQSCIAAKRFIVVPEVRDAFERMFVERMKKAKVGDPSDDETEVGPLARVDLRDELHGQVQRSVDLGARLLLGGEIPERPGAWYPPTVLADVGPGMPAYDDELFGPVGAIIPAKNEEDAIRIANDTVYGLGAAVFTRDQTRGETIAVRRLEAGACFVNAYVRSDPRLPFGGIKQSGYGRELGEIGIHELVNVKTVWVGGEPAPAIADDGTE